MKYRIIDAPTLEELDNTMVSSEWIKVDCFLTYQYFIKHTSHDELKFHFFQIYRKKRWWEFWL